MFIEDKGLGPISDHPCSICGKKGNTNYGICHSLYRLFWCPNHTEDEIAEAKLKARQKAIRKEWATENTQGQ